MVSMSIAVRNISRKRPESGGKVSSGETMRRNRARRTLDDADARTEERHDGKVTRKKGLDKSGSDDAAEDLREGEEDGSERGDGLRRKGIREVSSRDRL